jgi:signal transduction histidine kinase
MNTASSAEITGGALAERAGEAREASGSRRRPADAPTRFDAVRAGQLRAVGTGFLRARPLVVAPVAIANAALLAASGAPIAQRIALGAGFGLALALFSIERWMLRHRVVSERWLAASLALTTLLLASGCALSGALDSPVLPLLVTPAIVATAAFGRARITLASYALTLVAVGALVLLGPHAPWPAVPAPWAHAMTAVAIAGLLALAYAGVAGLIDAHARTGQILDRMRLATIEEAASRMRATEQVGAKVAHELKNPLAGIKALIQLVRGGELSAKAAERLGVALGEIDRMDGIVRDYLAFARPLADLEPAPLDVRGIADDVASVLAARAELAGVALTAAGAAPPIEADARRVREAIYNLVDNALAATPRGGRVAIEVTAERGGVRVTIDDTGPGIAPEIAAGLGAPFLTTKPEGTGLGLTIARAAIAQHGGTLALESRAGTARDPGGTRAMIYLPHHLPHHLPHASPHAPDGAP